jgi:hypothetical protein
VSEFRYRNLRSETKQCAECGSDIEVKVGGRGNVRRFCDRNCAQKAGRKHDKIHRPNRLRGIARLGRERRRDTPSDELLAWLDAGDRTWAEGPAHQFSMAMVRGAVADLKAKTSTGPTRESAAQWLRGDLDDELETPCRAATCFEVMRIDHGSAIEALGI